MVTYGCIDVTYSHNTTPPPALSAKRNRQGALMTGVAVTGGKQKDLGKETVMKHVSKWEVMLHKTHSEGA